MTWLVRGGFDCYRTISESKKLLFKLLENWEAFEIRDVFVACGQVLPLCPTEWPVMKYYVLVCEDQCHISFSTLSHFKD